MIDGSTPSSTARAARQSIRCNLPRSATALLTRVTMLTTAAATGTGAKAKPLVAPITIMPRPKPVTVWK
ncbi:hypothetical protein D3C78_1859840 [compost metagenome]